MQSVEENVVGYSKRRVTLLLKALSGKTKEGGGEHVSEFPHAPAEGALGGTPIRPKCDGEIIS